MFSLCYDFPENTVLSFAAGSCWVRHHLKEETPMKHPFARRSLGAVLALLLVLPALSVSALAARTENAEFTLMELKGTDVTLDETVFTYTGHEIKPNVTVRVEDRLLTLDQDYTLKYENNVEVGTGKVIVTGIATAAPSYGYTGTVEVPFYINEKTPEFTLIELKGTDVTINGTEFVSTGSPIEPAVTVNVGGKTLTPEQDYTVEYVNNLLPGTATVIVRGIATASETVGYTGEVRIDFTIIPAQEETDPPVELTALNVTLEGERFPYTGSPITPAVTVQVEGKTLESGRDYTLTYENNVQPGTGSVTVSAVEGSGYAGRVTVNFTITGTAQEEYPLVEIKPENVTLSGTKFTYTGSPITPKVTVTVGGKVLISGKDYSLTYTNNTQPGTATVTVAGIATATETGGYTGTVELKFTIAPQYKITQGSGAVFTKGSSATLSFTVNADEQAFDYLSINGKTVDPKYYTMKDGSAAVLTLKNSFLNILNTGSYTITFHFTDGEAEGTFKVAAAADDTNHKTGDEFPLHLLSAVMFVSLTGILGGLFAWKKKLF